MKKLFVLFCLVLFFSTNAFAEIAVSWDPYSDPQATGIRLQQSTDQTTWSTLIDNIAVSAVGVALPAHGTVERVWYRLVAFSADDISAPSNTVSLFWNTDGTVIEGLSGPGNFKWIDCNNPQGDEVQICNDLGISPN